MYDPLPLKLLGRYIVPSPCVLSVFDGARLVRRYWPFIVTKVFDDGIESHNTTTGHNLRLAADEIVGWVGDIEGPPRYLEPLKFHLSTQIYWDAVNLWRVPIHQGTTPRFRKDRVLRLRRAA